MIKVVVYDPIRKIANHTRTYPKHQIKKAMSTAKRNIKSKHKYLVYITEVDKPNPVYTFHFGD